MKCGRQGSYTGEPFTKANSYLYSQSVENKINVLGLGQCHMQDMKAFLNLGGQYFKNRCKSYYTLHTHQIVSFQTKQCYASDPDWCDEASG